MKQLTIREAADFLLRNDNYVLLTHRRPDGDPLGSAAALCAGLRSLGKTAHVLENPQFTEKFRPWLGKLTCETLPSSACVVSVDIAAENLLPFDLPDCAIELQIDHHAGTRPFGLQAFVDASAAACGEIILRLLQLMGVKLDASMGAALYVAISTDTGCFRFNNTTADTLRCAAACKDTGADTFAINTALFMTKRLPRLPRPFVWQSAVTQSPGRALPSAHKFLSTVLVESTVSKTVILPFRAFVRYFSISAAQSISACIFVFVLLKVSAPVEQILLRYSAHSVCACGQPVGVELADDAAHPNIYRERIDAPEAEQQSTLRYLCAHALYF